MSHLLVDTATVNKIGVDHGQIEPHMQWCRWTSPTSGVAYQTPSIRRFAQGSDTIIPNANTTDAAFGINCLAHQKYHKWLFKDAHLWNLQRIEFLRVNPQTYKARNPHLQHRLFYFFSAANLSCNHNTTHLRDSIDVTLHHMVVSKYDITLM